MVKRAALHIQCKDPVSGETGSFLVDADSGENCAMSPVFGCVTEVYEWAKSNGWQLAPYDSEFPVGVFEMPQGCFIDSGIHKPRVSGPSF